MNERYIKWYTPYLSREFEMLAFGNGGGLPLILFPTSFGRYHQNKDFGLVGSVSGYVDSGKVTVYCPDAHSSTTLHSARNDRVSVQRDFSTSPLASFEMTGRHL
jgi:esterase/lipase superfamily enzyme